MFKAVQTFRWAGVEISYTGLLAIFWANRCELDETSANKKDYRFDISVGFEFLTYKVCLATQVAGSSLYGCWLSKVRLVNRKLIGNWSMIP